MNLYQYVGNNPVNFIDPYGELVIVIPVVIEVAKWTAVLVGGYVIGQQLRKKYDFPPPRYVGPRSGGPGGPSGPQNPWWKPGGPNPWKNPWLWAPLLAKLFNDSVGAKWSDMYKDLSEQLPQKESVLENPEDLMCSLSDVCMDLPEIPIMCSN